MDKIDTIEKLMKKLNPNNLDSYTFMRERHEFIRNFDYNDRSNTEERKEEMHDTMSLITWIRSDYEKRYPGGYHANSI